ncbi:branched-chain amino acid:cation transporter, LIVCS family [Dethiosulfatibacter aminovorans DSM 17477]|uniref:Branched-chain amino acid transport system carrier protein n=1 Tax=Dethiosulfatibacter aminovorans DSM 17477 TaxID=1121476 RepID=A0A1M6C560_9FIRM|nr:branched-chain amino acid transport system II carrier protein [Dethiosulfatibacter aminovorans]SHI56073.1 branched-chain amino acid:cation transporter, LIVCS family [Dethiosulfatibacter aminovorans DSM 17477]
MFKFSKATKDIIVVGFAIFAIFFGAGNLIFPPWIGQLSGSAWFAGLMGLVITGIALPILAVVAVGNGGGTFKDLTQPVAPWFYKVYNFLIMICLGFLITHPRVGAVAYETGVRTLLPNVNQSILQPVALIVFFGLAAYFSINSSKVVDKVGEILTPILLVTLSIIIGLAIFRPIGAPVDTGIENAFYSGFINAYQIGDVLTGLLCGVIFINALKDKGYGPTTEKLGITTLLKSCLVAFTLLTFVYGGLEYLGATGGSLFEQGTDQTVLLIGLVRNLGGSLITYTLAICVVVACLTTSTGLMSVLAGYINDTTKEKIPYKAAVVIVAVVAVIQAMGGVAKIIVIAGPIFMFVYPLSIVLVLLGCFKKFIPNDGIWKGTILAASIIGLYDGMSIVSAIAGFSLPSGLTAAYNAIPLASQGFAWIVPVMVFGTVGYFISKNNEARKSNKNTA